MTAAIVLLLCWVVLVIAGNTPIGRLLNRLMVEMPATALNRLEPGHVALAIVVTILVIVHLTAGDSDPIRMVALFAPDMVLWLMSFEIGAIVEAVVALTAAAAALRRAGVDVGVRAALKTLCIRPPRHAKNTVDRARKGPRRDRKSPANDDDDGAAFALAS